MTLARSALSATSSAVRLAALAALTLAAAMACSSASETEGRPSPDAGAAASDASRRADAATTRPIEEVDPPLCVDGKSVDGAYPKRDFSIALFGTLPDLSFRTEPTAEGDTLALHEYFEPCAARSRLLVLRVSAGWCGTCRWSAAHTAELRATDVGSRLRIVDLVVADDDNAPADLRALAPWRARIDAPERVAIDPGFQLRPLNAVHGALPLVVLVDTRTMKVENMLNNPDPGFLEWRIRDAFAALDGTDRPPIPKDDTVDGRFLRNQWDMIRDMKLPGAPPPDPTNAKADDPAAAALGKRLFSDVSLSPSNSVSCATCHAPDQQFSDGLAQSVGVAKVDRHTPTVLLASHSRWQFWDGRADSLWMQALGPLEDAKEASSSRLFVAHAIYDRYKASYEAVFGALPPLSESARFPASGKPGDASWQAMTPADQRATTRVFVNVGKAIAAFERTFRMKPTRFDAYVAGDLTALTDLEKDGLLDFFRAGCAQCHYGPRLTDDAFHAVRFPTGRQDGAADRGRIDAIDRLLASELNARGEFSDDRTPSASPHLEGLKVLPSMLGAFKTPTLRGVATSAPFGHGGTLATLDDVAKHYSSAGLADDDPRAVGEREPWLPKFANEHRDALPPILRALTAEIAP